jgi:nucleoid-associated protein YgaU
MMKKLILASAIMMFSLALVLAGCAQKPEAELEKAESALQAAKDAGAPELAADDYKAAENKLNEGKNLVDNKKYKDAKPVLENAASLADIARDKALAAKKPPVKNEPVAAPAPAPAPEKPVAQPVEKPKFEERSVVKGDCLWKIAGDKNVYGDPYQWPLIYDANKDQIKNPNLIYPKQNLKIPTDATPEEIEKARVRAGAKKESAKK